MRIMQCNTNEMIGFNPSGDEIMLASAFDTLRLHHCVETSEKGVYIREYELIFETYKHKVYENIFTNKRVYQEKLFQTNPNRLKPEVTR